MKILLFAGLAERLGTRELSLPAPAPTDVATLRTRLGEAHDELRGAVYRVAVDRSYVDDGASLAGAEEIALIPPVSGG